MVCLSPQLLERGRVFEPQELLELQMTVLTLEEEGLKVALISYLIYFTYSLDLAVFCFLNPMSQISIILSYFLYARFIFLSSGLLLVAAMVFSLFILFSQTLEELMLVTDLTCCCTFKIVFSSQQLTLEFQFYFMLRFLPFEFANTLDSFMLAEVGARFVRLVAEVWLDLGLKLGGLGIPSLLAPKLMLDRALAMLLQELPYSCFESDLSNFDELSEQPSFLELATDFLLLIYSRLELIRFNSLGSVNREFSSLLLVQVNSCFLEHSNSFFSDEGVEFLSLRVPLCDSQALDLLSSLKSFSSGISCSIVQGSYTRFSGLSSPSRGRLRRLSSSLDSSGIREQLLVFLAFSLMMGVWVQLLRDYVSSCTSLNRYYYKSINLVERLSMIRSMFFISGEESSASMSSRRKSYESLVISSISIQFKMVSASCFTVPSWFISWSASIPTISSERIFTTPSWVSRRSLVLRAEWERPSKRIISLTARAQEHSTDQTSFSSKTFFYWMRCLISFSRVWSRYSQRRDILQKVEQKVFSSLVLVRSRQRMCSCFSGSFFEKFTKACWQAYWLVKEYSFTKCRRPFELYRTIVPFATSRNVTYSPDGRLWLWLA